MPLLSAVDRKAHGTHMDFTLTELKISEINLYPLIFSLEKLNSSQFCPY